MSFHDQLPDSDGNGTLDASWGQGRAIYGGVLAAAGLARMEALVPPGRRVRSLSAQFLAPVAPEAYSVDAAVLRSGRAMTTLAATLLQDGKPRATFQAAFGEDRETSLGRAAPVRPVDAPPDVPPMPYIQGVMPAFTQYYEYRWSKGSMPFSGAAEASIRGWIRPRFPDVPGTRSLLGMLDAWPAPILTTATKPVPASTVSWSVHFRAPVERLGWFYYEADTLMASDGYSSFSGRLYEPGGALAAWTEQLVAYFG